MTSLFITWKLPGYPEGCSKVEGDHGGGESLLEKFQHQYLHSSLAAAGPLWRLDSGVQRDSLEKVLEGPGEGEMFEFPPQEATRADSALRKGRETPRNSPGPPCPASLT